ncbi:MAG: hypothetical protein EP330_27640 [Deltaproteobacteria bacterium]|nr:MAG: hypothetical protein EP330_27640 [Deltaproteobacteria bacterium]
MALLWVGAAQATTVSFIEQTRYASYNEYLESPYQGGGENLLLTNNSAWTTDASVAHRTRVRAPVAGDQVDWYIYDPNGQVRTKHAEYVYLAEYDDECWVYADWEPLCISYETKWTHLIPVLGRTTGYWTTDVYLNQELQYSTTFLLRPDGQPMDESYVELDYVSGDDQLVAAGAAIEPFVVRVTDGLGNPEADVPVSFAVVSKPGGPAPTLSSLQVFTDANGYAIVDMEPVTRQGDYVIEATNARAGTHRFDVRIGQASAGITQAAATSGFLDLLDVELDGELFTATVDPAGGAFLTSSTPLGTTYGTPVDLWLEVDATLYEGPVRVSWTVSSQAGGLPYQESGVFETLVGPGTGNGALSFTLPTPTDAQWSDFGPQPVTLAFDLETADGTNTPLGAQTVEADIRLFFPRDEMGVDANGAAVPNWLRFWSQAPSILWLEQDEIVPDRRMGIGLPATGPLLPTMHDEFLRRPTRRSAFEEEGGPSVFSDGEHDHRYDGPKCPQFRTAYWRANPWDEPFDTNRAADIVICDRDEPTIQWLANAIAHEHTHMTDWYFFWGGGVSLPAESSTWRDDNGDGIPDQLQPDWYETFALEVSFLVHDSAEYQWYRDQLDTEDWGVPGAQIDPGL